MDDKEIWKGINIITSVANHFNQFSAAEIIAIKKLMKESDLDIILIREQDHVEVRQVFYQNHGPELMQMCDEKSKEIRINYFNEINNDNMSYYGEQVIMKGCQIESFPVK